METEYCPYCFSKNITEIQPLVWFCNDCNRYFIEPSKANQKEEEPPAT